MAKEGRGSRVGAKKKKGEKMLAGTADRPRGAASGIDPRVQREIGKHLRAHYQDVLKEPVPDKFVELLQQLEKSIEKKS
jgi:hypothetical protein